MTEIDSNKLQAFKQKLQCLITTHNEDNTAHGDIRTAVAGKADSVDVPTKTSDLTNDSGFLTQHQDISGKANVADIPTKTSDLTNDSGFLTQHQDISGKANSADLANVATSGDYEDLNNIPAIPEDVSDLTDLQNTPFTPKSHSHVLADLTNFTTVEVVVTYTDGTTETRQLVQYVTAGG